MKFGEMSEERNKYYNPSNHDAHVERDLEKLIITQPVKKPLAFYGTKNYPDNGGSKHL
jgi:hypothetical protein